MVRQDRKHALADPFRGTWWIPVVRYTAMVVRLVTELPSRRFCEADSRARDVGKAIRSVYKPVHSTIGKQTWRRELSIVGLGA